MNRANRKQCDADDSQLDAVFLYVCTMWNMIAVQSFNLENSDAMSLGTLRELPQLIPPKRKHCAIMMVSYSAFVMMDVLFNRFNSHSL